MSWGDCWGTKPWSYHEKFVKAFMEGREIGGAGKTRVQRAVRPATCDYYMEYVYKGGVIARYTPESLMPAVIAHRLATGEELRPGIDYYPVMEFRCYHEDKGEARHLRALGIEAEWQYGGKPFLVFGADGDDLWRTVEEAKTLPKWVDTPKVPKRGPLPGRERFVNLTLPLFPEYA